MMGAGILPGLTRRLTGFGPYQRFVGRGGAPAGTHRWAIVT
jgi:hypothetical protein